MPVNLVRTRDAIVERTRTRFVEVLGASLAASQRADAATRGVLRSLSSRGAPVAGAVAPYSHAHAHMPHARQYSHGHVRLHDGLSGHHLGLGHTAAAVHAPGSARRAGWGRSSSAALDKAVALLQAASMGGAEGEVAGASAGAGAVGGKERCGSAHGIDLPVRHPPPAATALAPGAAGAPQVCTVSGLEAPLLPEGTPNTPVPAAASGEGNVTDAAAGDGASEVFLDRMQVVGYLGYFNSLDEFEGYQPCGCLYPLLRRAAPAYWQFVTAR